MVSLSSLTPESLETFRSLMGSPDFGGCFCAVWTSHDETWGARCADPAQPNFAITKRDVEAGRRAGYLVYEGEALVGWTGTGPKPEFPWLAEKLASRLTPSNPGTWSIGCLALLAKTRGRGLGDQVVSAVIDEARRRGAETLEAYPTLPWHEPRVFRGSHRLYERLGFAEAGREKDGDYDIVLMRLRL